MKLVQNDDGLAVKGFIQDGAEENVPAFDLCTAEQVVVQKLCGFFLEDGAVLGFGFLTGQEEERGLLPDELGDEGGLAHSAPPVQHDQGAAGAVIFGLQGLKLLLTVYKMLHEITSLLYFPLLYRRLL